MRQDEQDADEIAFRLAQIALDAGRLLRSLERASVAHGLKPDGTPTSGADLAAEQFILRSLDDAWPAIPVVAEETANAMGPADRFFLVDPLDGTSDFLSRSGEYSVNIALIDRSRPIASAVAVPPLGRVWAAGAGAWTGAIEDGRAEAHDWTPIQVRAAPDADLVALVSRRLGDPASEACLSALSISTRRTASSALKFCLIAGGEADLYVRCGPTMEWDTAAGDHILSRAGGAVIGSGGEPLTYGHEERGYRNGSFAALGDSRLAGRLSLREAGPR
jgi:3'(2'), 5'-bisphosphate nucleotidase